MYLHTRFIFTIQNNTYKHCLTSLFIYICNEQKQKQTLKTKKMKTIAQKTIAQKIIDLNNKGKYIAARKLADKYILNSKN